MARRLGELQLEIARSLNAMADVFSAAQWGGRAYKLPGPNGSLKKPKLLAFVVIADDSKEVHITFKLPKERAAAVIRQHDWIVREPFGTLGKSGWVLARVTTKRHAATLAKLLEESRAIYPHRQAENRSTVSKDGTGRTTVADPVARRIDRVMLEMKASGWSPRDDAFRNDSTSRRRPGETKRRRKSRSG